MCIWFTAVDTGEGLSTRCDVPGRTVYVCWLLFDICIYIYTYTERYNVKQMRGEAGGVDLSGGMHAVGCS